MLLKRQIKALRRNRHLSQKDLAIELGITRQHVYYLERGARLPSKKIQYPPILVDTTLDLPQVSCPCLLGSVLPLPNLLFLVVHNNLLKHGLSLVADIPDR